MDHLILKEKAALEASGEAPSSTSIQKWSGLGPLLLLAAFAIMLFKSAPLYWPLTLTAFMGHGVVRVGKKKGLFFSAAALCCIGFYTLRKTGEPFWVAILASSILCAWLLIYLDEREKETASEEREKREASLSQKLGEKLEQKLDQKQKNLEQQMREIGKSLSDEKERVCTLTQTHAKELALCTDRENAKLMEQQTLFSKELMTHRQTAESLSTELKGAFEKIAQLQEQVALLSAPSLVCEELSDESNSKPNDEPSDEKLLAQQVQFQYELLRDQFNHKAETLDQTRKELFRVENELLTLQRAWEEKQFEAPEEFPAYLHDLKKTEEKALEMERQVLALQEVISSLLSQKKRAAPRKKSGKSTKQSGINGTPELF